MLKSGFKTHHQESPTKSSLLWKSWKYWLESTIMQTVEAAIWSSCLTQSHLSYYEEETRMCFCVCNTEVWNWALYLSYRLHPTFILITNNSDNCTQNGKHLKYAWQRWNFTGLPVFCSLGDYFTPNFGLLGNWLTNLWLLLSLCNLQTLRFLILYISPSNHRKR